MARGKRIIGINAVNQQIETAEAEVKSLLDKKKALQTEELMNAVMKSRNYNIESLQFQWFRAETGDF